MKDYIQNEADYLQVMEQVEVYLSKATALGGFHLLPASDKEALSQLSLLAEQYEDGIPIMPLRQAVEAAKSDMLPFSKIQSLYPNEWVLLGDPVLEGTEIVSGRVILHHADKKELTMLGHDLVSGYANHRIVFTETPQKEAVLQPKVSLKRGSGKHLITYMADDFTAPLEDLKEYME